ncbi:DoxX family protein [[Flexibacter] sp. ATCC 35208]|uniref:DoxX family protein n=1 Tax=[Flexibacter] sp. ATCC 35208 TaxID=1936242 RepID=UPI0009C71931|nr:DoxX family protein [[Flexibacter] sp. ATCC 35208]OMP74947.1 DoxX-like family protein [[Flexibacter] sp. ATCC 35208]
MTKRNNIIYWTATIFLSLFMFVGGIAQILRQKDNVDGIIHLGYPLYFMTILGVWKILGVIAILTPRFPLVKEWAYAGFFFAMTGAVISHIAAGDQFAHFIAPLVFAILTVVSWYFRPAGRKL